MPRRAFGHWAIRTVGLVVVTAAGVPVAAGSWPGRTRLAILSMGRAPRPMPFAASHLGVRWHGTGAAWVEVRYSGLAGWMPWQRVAVDHDLDDEERGLRFSGLIRTPGAVRVQVRAAGAVERVDVVVIDARAGRPARLRTAAPMPFSSASASQPEAAADRPDVVTRAEWGANESIRKGVREFAPVSKLVVHHTVSPNDDPDPEATVRAIYAYHVQARGWDDIGYNFLVDAAGRIYEGRWARDYPSGEFPNGEDEMGNGVVAAHAKGANHGSVGVAVLGDFTSTPPTSAAVETLIRLLAWKAARHGVDAKGAAPFTYTDGSTRSFPNVAGHREVVPTGCPGNSLYASLPQIRERVAETAAGMLPEEGPPAPEQAAAQPPPPIPGFWVLSADGTVEAVGDAPFFGSMAGPELNAPMTSMAVTPTGGGYWLASADGGVFAFGDAPFFGSAGWRPLPAPAVRLEPTPTGGGYWLAMRDGGVIAYGDARFHGSPVPAPGLEIVGMAATSTGDGYWLASADGRVFAFGDALVRRAGSGRAASEAVGGSDPPSAPVVSMAAAPSGQGYWLATRDGGVSAVDVSFWGRPPEYPPDTGAVQIRATETGEGYYVAGADGAVFAFGDAESRRQRPGRAGASPVVDVVMRPLRARDAAEGQRPVPVPVPEAPATPPGAGSPGA